MFKKLLKERRKKIKKIKNFLFYNKKEKNFKIIFSIKEKKIVNIFILNSVLIMRKSSNHTPTTKNMRFWNFTFFFLILV